MAAQNSSSPRYKTDVIRVVVADSTLMGNQLLAAALKSDGRFCVVGTAETSEQVLAALRSPLDVVVVSPSIGSRHSNGFHLTRSIRAAHPDVRVVMLLDRSEPDSVVESFRAGASGVFCRAEPLEVLWNCIQSVYEGKIWANNEELTFVVEALVSSTLPRLTAAGNACLLTPREQKVVSLVAEGLTNLQIAAELNLSQHTIKNHLFRIFEKLEVSTRVELVFAALGHPDAARSYPITPEEPSAFLGDDSALFEWYSRAAEHLFPFAQLKVGEMHLNGRGTTKDLVSAYMWFSLSEETGKRISEASNDWRQALQSRMTAAQIAEAGRRASDWLRQHPGQLKPLGQRPSGTNRHADEPERSDVPREKRLVVV
jgi:two-component system, NarL family, nitrate/nitrite response regulator NarL